MTQTGTLKDSGAQVIDMTYAQRGEAGDVFPEPVSDAAGVRPSVAVFANRPRVRSEICDDLTGAGFRTLDNGPVDVLVDGPITLMGDVVMVDCPSVDGAVLAALSRLDQRVARTGAHLIVSTTLDALDDVFAALDQSHPQIMVQPTRAERIIAVGRVMADMSSSRVREMSDEDRLNLLYLSRQVEAIAHKLEGLSDHSLKSGTALSGGVQKVKTQSEQLSNEKSGAPAFNSSRPRLPDPGFVRRVIAARQTRAKFFDAELFADPAWDMLLDLTAAHGENIRVSVTSLCIAASVPATISLRWLKQMVDCGIFERIADPSDKRRAFIALSSTSLEGMARYFEEVEVPLANAA
ncbi:MarR family transcriptional regulator [Erythrobacter sp. YT30]|uniref:MarR family transcriptional regulator n=1 Tax=Erythrobacter sp. YT30 TaxID=1735012 RepID=UPI000A3E86D8|nr:MarR family transcriptional regulator [Erythrobacter sp. YT30]